MEIEINNISLKPDQGIEVIEDYLQEKYKIQPGTGFRIVKKSLDARNKKKIVYRYRIVIDVAKSVAKILLKNREISIFQKAKFPRAINKGHGNKIIIIGSGPAGLFCALRLIEGGCKVDIIERGKPISERINDIRSLENDGVLDEESNVLFGEGGAGTYSDGKLTTRINRPERIWLFERLIEFGAPDSISYDSKPHLGTDRLRSIIKNIREHLRLAGSQIHFNSKVTKFIITDETIRGVRTENEGEYISPIVVLACGHSARDIYSTLNQQGVDMEKKGFAVGVRIEHPAELINKIQYGKSPYREILPAADYCLTYNNRATSRGIYSFCMCPGGRIINASSEKGRLCTNGMSFSGRDLYHSNAAIIVNIGINDIEDHVLAGIGFQRMIEESAFLAGGGDYRAPAQSIPAFLADKIDNQLPEVSYRPGVIPSNVRDFLPLFIVEELVSAFHQFKMTMKGFISSDAILVGAETRSSSPIRILRNSGFEAPRAQGLYPIGEGAGYSGGIVSSAVDGIRAADIILNRI